MVPIYYIYIGYKMDFKDMPNLYIANKIGLVPSTVELWNQSRIIIKNQL